MAPLGLSSRLKLTRNLQDHVPALGLGSQQQRPGQCRLHHIPQLIPGLQCLRRFRPNPTTIRALRCTTRHPTWLPLVPNRASSPRNRTRGASPVVFDSRRLHQIRAQRRGHDRHPTEIIPFAPRPGGRGSAPPTIAMNSNRPPRAARGVASALTRQLRFGGTHDASTVNVSGLVLALRQRVLRKHRRPERTRSASPSHQMFPPSERTLVA